jgi:hypothetical protein
MPSRLDDVQFYRLVGRLCRCGAPAVAGLLLELGRERMIRVPIEEKLLHFLERLERRDPAAMAILGIDKLPPPKAIDEVHKTKSSAPWFAAGAEPGYPNISGEMGDKFVSNVANPTAFDNRSLA